MTSFSLSSTAGPSTPVILSDYCATIHASCPSNGLHMLSPHAQVRSIQLCLGPVSSVCPLDRLQPCIGLGILVRCPDTNSLSILSPLGMRRASPTLGVPRTQALLCRRVQQGAGPLMARSHAAPAPHHPAPRPASIVPPRSKYAGLGYGFPKHLHANRGYRRPAASSAITRIVSVTQCRLHLAAAQNRLVPSGVLKCHAHTLCLVSHPSPGPTR
ncbi:hypothetical protein C8R47DRAFT_8466 [Mycena vitilis]|nr:hypothetical protein C8R47DRAFT_8466 [Mycena vitilis]